MKVAVLHVYDMTNSGSEKANNTILQINRLFKDRIGLGGIFHSAVQFNDIINVVFSSKPFVVGLVAFFLDNTLHRHDSAARKDRGYHWWEKFRSYKTDNRSDEFYPLPFILNQFFPAAEA